MRSIGPSGAPANPSTSPRASATSRVPWTSESTGGPPAGRSRRSGAATSAPAGLPHGVDDRGVAEGREGLPVGDRAPVADDGADVGDGADLVHAVRHQDRGDVLVGSQAPQ